MIKGKELTNDSKLRGLLRLVAKIRAINGPAEAAPIIIFLKKKKREGVEIEPIVDTMMAAVASA